MAIYDFVALRKRFNDMSDMEMAEEYAKILQEYEDVDKLPFASDEFCRRIEPLDQASEFLSHRLACKFCESMGVKIH